VSSLAGAALEVTVTTKARVFLSHCGFEDDVRDVLEALVAVLPQDDFEILLDRFTLRPSEDLTKTINGWLWSCDAAVVVVDPKALEFGVNPWVFSEAVRLQDRLETIEVIPVFVGGARPAHVKNKLWEPTGLDTPLGVCDAGLSPNALAVQLAETLKDMTLKRVRASGVTRRLALILTSFDSSLLRDAAVSLKEPRRDWSSQRLQHEIAQRLLEVNDFDVVMDVLVKLAESDLERAGEALYVILPFTWVDRRAAGAIHEALKLHMPVGLNTVQIPTTQAYVARCASEWPPPPVHAVNPASDPEYVHFQKDLEKRLKRLKCISGARRTRLQLFGVVCEAKVDPKLVGLLEECISTHHHVGLLFLIGNLKPKKLPRPLRDKIVHVEPKIDPVLEQEALMRLPQGRHQLWERHNEDRSSRGWPEVRFPWKA
jgi:hypothetical protein